MNRSLLRVSTAALLLCACEVTEKPANQAADANGAAAVSASAEEQAIRGRVDRWHELIKDKDAAGIAKLYTDDGSVMPPNAAIGSGPAAIEKTWAGLLQIPGFDLQIVPVQIVVASAGDMALDRGTYTLKIAPDGTVQTDTGKYVVVWRKVGGEWRAAADIFNSDLPAGG